MQSLILSPSPVRKQSIPKMLFNLKTEDNQIEILSGDSEDDSSMTEQSDEKVYSISTNFLEFEGYNGLYRHAWDLFVISDVEEAYMMKRSTFNSFIKETSRLYEWRGNPYHNFRHGITVMNKVYHFRNSPSVIKGEYFTTLGTAALLFAGLMHDIDHRGKNNTYEINSLSDLALTYNDVSVLESHHSALAFELLTQKGKNIFESMHKLDYPFFRQFVIHAILSTDVKNHFEHLAAFKEKLESFEFDPVETNEDYEDFLLLIGVLTHTADLYVPTLPLKDSL